MSIKVAKSRFIVSSLMQHAGFYQQLFKRVLDFKELGQRLISAAETAIAFRQIEQVEESGLMLSCLPIKECQRIGQYYSGWCAYRKGEKAQGIFEQVIEQSTTYKAKGYISLAALVSGKGDYNLGIKYYVEAIQHDKSPSIVVPTIRSIAIIKGMEGSHQHALKDLEGIYPLAHYAGPKAYYDYLNSLAVELGEAGRIEEARKVIRIVLASPFAFAYPEWRETSDEIELRGYKSRSVVSLTQRKPENVLYLPERSPVSDTTQSRPAPILDYLKWKKKMVKEPNGEDNDKLPEDMSRQDMAMKILEIITQNKEDESKLRKLLDYTVELFSGPKKSDK